VPDPIVPVAHDPNNLKRCTKCGELKPATTEYFPFRTDVHRLRATCRACSSLKRHGYYEIHKEETLAQSSQWKRENKERRKKTSRQWYDSNRATILERGRAAYHAAPDYQRERKQRYKEANREILIEKRRLNHVKNQERDNQLNREWYARNKDVHREAGRQWRKNNREQSRACINRYRARKVSAPGSYSADDVKLQYAAQRGKCWWCGKKVGTTYHVDHVIPLRRGGTNYPENIVIACPPCNSSKRDKLPQEWAGRLF
jgi:5-methylcytosine-specific restriction endonuclease McrA